MTDFSFPVLPDIRTGAANSKDNDRVRLWAYFSVRRAFATELENFLIHGKYHSLPAAALQSRLAAEIYSSRRSHKQ
jgi:hypothetical protein